MHLVQNQLLTLTITYINSYVEHKHVSFLCRSDLKWYHPKCNIITLHRWTDRWTRCRVIQSNTIEGRHKYNWDKATCVNVIKECTKLKFTHQYHSNMRESFISLTDIQQPSLIQEYLLKNKCGNLRKRTEMSDNRTMWNMCLILINVTPN